MKNSVTPHMLSFLNRRHITAIKLDESLKDIINLYISAIYQNEFTKSDVADLSPYLTRHIKRFGDYSIGLTNIPKAIDLSISIPMKQDIAT